MIIYAQMLRGEITADHRTVNGEEALHGHATG